MPAWTLRPADPADAAAIARVHAVARREAYAAFLPPPAIDDRTLAERAAVWTQRLADPPARAFYERVGGRALGLSRGVEVAGHTLLEVAYGWPADPGASGPAR